MVAKTVDNILRKKSLNVTEIRRHIILLLHRPGIALTQKEIEAKLEKHLEIVDRVTVYRNIKTLLKKNIIHSIPIDVDKVKYKLVREYNKNNHPHFFCFKCNKVLCMPQLEIDKNKLPKGFSITTSKVVMEGVCSHCNLSY